MSALTVKKVCMLGASAVGKTSLIARFVTRIFSDHYLTTIGVRVDKKQVEVGGRSALLQVWDFHGDDNLQKVDPTMLRGMSGYLLVADGTRAATLEKVLELHQRITAFSEPLCSSFSNDAIPFVLILNKFDLQADWVIDDESIDILKERGWPVLKSSAKTGLGVDEAFTDLTRRMLQIS